VRATAAIARRGSAAQPLLALLARVLDDRIRAREHQAAVTILEAHEVGRLPTGSADLDDLAHPFWLTHDAAMYVESVPDDCLHGLPPLVRVN
jgi:hypothetical protein